MDGHRQLPTETTPLLSPSSEEKKELKTEAKKIVCIVGDSTIDNKAWIGFGGLYGNIIREQLGIHRDSKEARIQASEFSCRPPELSVVEHLEKRLGIAYNIFDYTNDGFTTYNVRCSGNKNVAFATDRDGLLRRRLGIKSLLPISFPEEQFSPLNSAKDEKHLQQANCIILSIGGNDFRNFLQEHSTITDEKEKQTDLERLPLVLETLQNQYIQILQRIRQENPTAKIILVTQYYPSAKQKSYDIYSFMVKLGKALRWGRNPNNPMDVIHEIMCRTYSGILKKIQDSKDVDFGDVTVADVTSSLNPFDNNNHVRQIEPSGGGGKKMAQMLDYMITRSTLGGYVYRFLPQFFTSQGDQDIQESPFNQWEPKHPHEFTGEASYEIQPVLQVFNQNESKALEKKEREAIYENKKIQQSFIVLQQVSSKLVTRENLEKLLHNNHLQDALSAAHGYLNSGRFGFWRTHGRHGRRETERFITGLMRTHDYGRENTADLMREWIRTSNVHNSSRAFYAYTSGVLELKESKDSKGYVTASEEERRVLLTKMIRKA